MPAPHVYRAINAVSKQLAAGIPKLHRNERDDYLYRSIDDVLNQLSPILAANKLCILPRVLERSSGDRLGEGDQLLVSVTLRVAFDLVSARDASRHTVEVFGEALDPGDKGTPKAMSSAYKAALLQTFCIPVTQIEEPEAHSHRLKIRHDAAPPEGWDKWTAGVQDIIASCQAVEALNRLKQRYRALLVAISRERPELYSSIGAAFSSRTKELSGPALPPVGGKTAKAQGPGSDLLTEGAPGAEANGKITATA